MRDASGDPSPGWNFVTLHAVMVEKVESLDRLTDAKFVTFRTLVDANNERVALALTASDTAITKAEIATEKRFDAVNEFRQQLADQASTFARREYVESQLATVAERLADQATARQLSLDQTAATVAKLVPREVFEAAVAASVTERDQLRDRCRALESRLDTATGLQQGGMAKTVDLRAQLTIAAGLITLTLGILIFVANILTGR